MAQAVNVSRPSLVWNGAMVQGAVGLILGGRERALSTTRPEEPIGSAWFQALGAPELDRAYRLAGFLLGDAADAEDATQDALTRAWAQRSHLRDEASGQAWFDRILVNVCRDRMRRRRIVRWTPIAGTEESAVADPFAGALARDAFLRAIGALDVDHRIVVVLRFAADLPIEAIAERLAIPAGTVKSRLHYAIRDLRRSAQGPAGDRPGDIGGAR
jgi:RNA polymerase sigma-70 factor, ECF subfamily